MKSKALLLILLLSLAFALTACETPHTHSFSPEWISNSTCHWQECECGARSFTAEHSGGEATETNKAVCSACGREYGELKEPEPRLDIPQVTVDDRGVASWGAVENAARYVYKINNGNEVSTSALSTILSDGDIIIVKAVSSTESYLDSAYSEPLKFVKPKTLEKPTVTVSESGVASWGAIENATAYLYSINGGEEKVTTELSVKLTEGDRITVIALGNGKEYLDSEKSNEVKYLVYATLDAPVISCDENGLVSWGAIENASGYVYVINGIKYPITTSLSVKLTDDANIKVKAVGDGGKYLDSSYAELNVVIKVVLEKPTVTISNDGVASWNKVENASGYLCKINGVEIPLTTELSVTLSDGDEISVKAIGNGEKYIDSEYTEAETYILKIVLATPAVTVDDSGVATWTAVEHALSYIYKINGIESEATVNLYVQLSKGDSIQVMAVGNGEKYINSEYSAKLSYGGPSANVVDFENMLSADGPLTDNCLPSIGTPNVLVIPVNLDSSKKTDKILEDIKLAFTGSSLDTGWHSVDTYYQLSSYGSLDFNFTVLDEWFTPSRTAAYYNDYYDEYTGNDGSCLILEEAIEYYDSKIDFTKYDNNSDGYVDAVWLIYNKDVDYDGDTMYWAFQYQITTNETYDGVGIKYFAFAGSDFMYEETETNEGFIIDAHTYIHETGHLMGLDDYYDYDESTGPSGGLYWADMMDSNLGDHSAISKLLLNWINPTVISGEGSIILELNSFTTTGDVLLIANHELSSVYDEYFLIEFYTEEGLNENDMPIYDEYQTVYGIRILHVDARKCYDYGGDVTYNDGDSYYTGFLYDNSDTSKLFVDTMCQQKPNNAYGYATSEILFTDTSRDFGIDVYQNYKYHDGTSLNFTLKVLEMTGEGAKVEIVID